MAGEPQGMRAQPAQWSCVFYLRAFAQAVASAQGPGPATTGYIQGASPCLPAPCQQLPQLLQLHVPPDVVQASLRWIIFSEHHGSEVVPTAGCGSHGLRGRRVREAAASLRARGHRSPGLTSRLLWDAVTQGSGGCRLGLLSVPPGGDLSVTGCHRRRSAPCWGTTPALREPLAGHSSSSRLPSPTGLLGAQHALPGMTSWQLSV